MLGSPKLQFKTELLNICNIVCNQSSLTRMLDSYSIQGTKQKYGWFCLQIIKRKKSQKKKNNKTRKVLAQDFKGVYGDSIIDNQNYEFIPLKLTHPWHYLKARQPRHYLKALVIYYVIIHQVFTNHYPPKLLLPD